MPIDASHTMITYLFIVIPPARIVAPAGEPACRLPALTTASASPCNLVTGGDTRRLHDTGGLDHLSLQESGELLRSAADYRGALARQAVLDFLKVDDPNHLGVELFYGGHGRPGRHEQPVPVGHRISRHPRFRYRRGGRKRRVALIARYPEPP